MRVLWVCNIMLPMIAESLLMKASNREGWLSGLANMILKQYRDNQIDLGICFPQDEGTKLLRGKIAEVSYYGFYENVRNETKYGKYLDEGMVDIIADFEPDIVHIFGTEFPHALSMAKAFHNPDRTLVGIQGVCIACAKHYMDGIPVNVQRRFTLRDFLKQDNIRQQQKKFYVRAKREEKVLQSVLHVTGRTDLDRTVSKQLNPDIQYHFMNETLRAGFYEAEWDLGKCERHSILLSQGDYPLKGFHYMLQALPLIREQYRDVHVYITGNIITKHGSMMEKIKLSSYGKYLLQLINEHNLEDNITFLGMADSREMRGRMLKSHVFVSPSTMENSPNSVGEAMLLGLPVVSSKVGGVTSLVTDEVEGFLYEAGKPSILASNVCRIFADDAVALKLSRQARKRAAKTHNPTDNYQRLIEIYQSICKLK